MGLHALLERRFLNSVTERERALYDALHSALSDVTRFDESVVPHVRLHRVGHLVTLGYDVVNERSAFTRLGIEITGRGFCREIGNYAHAHVTYNPNSENLETSLIPVVSGVRSKVAALSRWEIGKLDTTYASFGLMRQSQTGQLLLVVPQDSGGVKGFVEN